MRNSKMESFIRSKYESRRWAMDGPPPNDPSILDTDTTAEVPPPPPQQEQSIAAPSARSTHGSIAVPPRNSGFATQQPQAHQLLSSNFTRPTPVQTPAQPTAQPAQPPPPQDDLFSLDFHAPPPVPTSNAAPQQPPKDVKQDILSLFSASPANSHPNPMNQLSSTAWTTPSQPQQPVQPTSMIGNTGIGAWGTSSGWGSVPAAPPVQPNVWGTPANTSLSTQQANFFNTNDIWGGNSVTSGGGSFSPPTTQKKDDVFGDIWGSFK